jgi:hypothetical protein
MVVRYEDLMADPAGAIERIAAWAGIASGDGIVAQALTATGHSATFNKGGSGRGGAVPETVRAEILALTAYYSDVDFSPLVG